MKLYRASSQMMAAVRAEKCHFPHSTSPNKASFVLHSPALYFQKQWYFLSGTNLEQFLSECKPLVRHLIVIIFYIILSTMISVRMYHLRIMFDHCLCQNIHVKNRCFKEFTIFWRKNCPKGPVWKLFRIN